MRSRSTVPFAVVVVAAACGSATPTGDCQNIVSTVCNKLFQCAATVAAQQYGNESACETKLRSQYACDSWACPSGQTYDGSAVESCINAYDNLSCADITQQPAQCQNIGPACH
jgi:hypothetical protein